MTPKGKMKSYMGCLWTLCLFMALVVMFLMFATVMSGCKHVEYVPVETTHEIHHHHTDSIKESDSVYHEKETIIQQLDSAAMAKYGIQIKNAERAWLVRTAELERRLQELSEAHTDTVYRCDTIPCPVEVIKEVPAELNWWQTTLVYLGGAWLVILSACAVFGIWKLYRKFKP